MNYLAPCIFARGQKGGTPPAPPSQRVCTARRTFLHQVLEPFREAEAEAGLAAVVQQGVFALLLYFKDKLEST